MKDQIEKQAIEEMVKDLCDIECKGMKCDICDSYGCEYRMQAEALYNAGYRKQSEGEWRIVSDYADSRIVECSKCDKQFYFKKKGQLNIDKMPCCPFCGAKMKGGAE